MAVPDADSGTMTGFATLDSKGRLPVAKALREALGLRPGSSVGYVLLEGLLLVVPQDEHLARLTEQAAAALAKAGLTTQDPLDAIPAARAEVVRELYGDAVLAELARERERAAATRGG